jgi:hypothetical protein
LPRPSGDWLESFSHPLNGAPATLETPEPSQTREPPQSRSRSLQLYWLLLASCSTVATCFFLACRSRWNSWGAAVARVLADTGLNEEELTEAALFGFRKMILGLLGAIFLLVWDEYRFGRSETLLYSEPWTFFRVPVLTSLAFAFACYAAAFRACSRKRSTQHGDGNG